MPPPPLWYALVHAYNVGSYYLFGHPFQLILEALQLCYVAPGAVGEPLANALQGTVDHPTANISSYLDLIWKEKAGNNARANDKYKITLDSLLRPGET